MASIPDPTAFVRPDIRAMHGYVPGEQIPGAIKLNTNECPWPPSPRVMQTLHDFAAEPLRVYPNPVSAELRTVAAEIYGVRPEQILVGNGSDDCLTILYRAFLAPGEAVACPWPTYGLYDMLATLQGARFQRLPFLEKSLPGHATDWEMPAGLAALGAKLTILANPNNPSATMLPVSVLRRLAEEVAGILVVDEAYVDFAIAEGVGESMLPLLDAHPNLIVLRTFSKSYSLAGARLGLLFAAPALVRELEKVKDSYNVNAMTQALGVAALRDQDHHREIVRLTLAEKARLSAALAAHGWSWPVSGANFVLAEVGAQAGALQKSLKEKGVLVRHWNTRELATKLRITVGTPEQNDRLLAALDELRGKAR